MTGSRLALLRERRARFRARPVAPTWRAQAAVTSALALVALVALLGGARSPLDLAMAAAVALLGTSAALNARASGTLAERRRSEAESFERILRALSRSVSPDAIVEAIVHQLGAATGADHVAVVRLRPGTTVFEVTFVSTLPGAPTSNTTIARSELGPADAPPFLGRGPHRRASERALSDAATTAASFDGAWHPRAEGGRDARASARIVADAIAARLRAAYGLRNTLAAPLRSEGAIVGAIVLSRRTGGSWPEDVARLLDGAAAETSAALARVYSYQAAEAEARIDQLTQLPNRRYLDEYCALVATGRRAADRVGILAIDVDNFKRLNDEHGHLVGDEVLRAVADAIRSSVRGEDVPARYGGEEFVVLLRNPGQGVALEVGERVRVAVRALDLAEFEVDRVTVSVGVALAESAEEPIAAIVERADRALYRAKRAGRDRVVQAAPPVLA